MIKTKSGRSVDELTIDALREGNLAAADFRISREALARQAEAAHSAGYVQLAENLRRAAELSGLSNQELLDMYELLRPGRATYDELAAVASRLESEQDMPRVAAFVREAASVYRARGILKQGVKP